MSEIDMVMEAYGSVMDAVCEGNHVIDKNEREGLDDKDFGLILFVCQVIRIERKSC